MDNLNQRALMCKLFGHRWRDISSRQYVTKNGEFIDSWIKERTCTRCGIVEHLGIEPWKEGVTKR